eukprot:SAG31_NODE_41055_length_278_cov_0.569832_1_plen_68_part_10
MCTLQVEFLHRNKFPANLFEHVDESQLMVCAWSSHWRYDSGYSIFSRICCRRYRSNMEVMTSIGLAIS